MRSKQNDSKKVKLASKEKGHKTKIKKKSYEKAGSRNASCVRIKNKGINEKEKTFEKVGKASSQRTVKGSREEHHHKKIPGNLSKEKSSKKRIPANAIWPSASAELVQVSARTSREKTQKNLKVLRQNSKESAENVPKKIRELDNVKTSHDNTTKEESGSQKGGLLTFTADAEEGSQKFVDWVLQANGNGCGLSKLFAENVENYVAPQELRTSTAFSSDSNKEKNRSTDLTCYDQTRVKLPTDEMFTSDYIHANTITFKNCDRSYIATQLPLEETRVDFWRMVVTQEVETIVALFDPSSDEVKKKTKASRAGKPSTPTNLTTTSPTRSPTTAKPSQRGQKTLRRRSKDSEDKAGKEVTVSTGSNEYWPLREGDYINYGPYFIHTRKVAHPDLKLFPTIYTIEVVEENCANATFVKLINFPQWTTGKLPSSRVILKLISQIREILIDPLRKGNVLVHCDTGINRTAVVILCDVIIHCIFNNLEIDVVELCRELRNQRASCLQNRFYFLCVIFVVLEYIHSHCCQGSKINLPMHEKISHVVKQMAIEFSNINAKEFAVNIPLHSDPIIQN
ncbi:unnamed protein product [Caenorhabditis auriculariae]|uniref:Tyrosine-protein phosphatase domain-containing protein n=1 Tax=Caenorhabditis auriculariae TaxID=2777116 RepID=A0A8S1GQ55_9PELO|nr:unnamed protein product [Caenorhabditis auriculariae]